MPFIVWQSIHPDPDPELEPELEPDPVVAGGAVVVVAGAEVSMQLAVHLAPDPPLLLLFERKRTLRVRPLTVTSGEFSSQNFSFPIFMKSLPLLQLEFLAVRVNAEQEKFSLHLLRFPRLNLTTHLTFLPYVSVSWVEKSTDSPTARVIVSLDLPEGQV